MKRKDGQRSTFDLLRRIDESDGEEAELEQRMDSLSNDQLEAVVQAVHCMSLLRELASQTDGQTDDDSKRSVSDHAGPLKPGTVMCGRYHIESLIGQGGFANVYRALDTTVGREVAIKISRDPKVGSERFLYEARAAGRLDHPGIVPIYDSFLDQGRPALVLAIVKGKSLGELEPQDWTDISGESDPQRRAAWVCMRIADAVGYAHRRQVVHRDLKPDNVLVTDQRSRPGSTTFARDDEVSKVRVTDFGLADILDESENAIESNADSAAMNDSPTDAFIAGTPGMMAPEQRRGESLITPAADVYAIGRMIQLHLADSSVATVDADMQAMVDQCLTADPRDRYADGSSLAVDLDRFLARRPVSVRPRGLVARTRLSLRRNAALSATILSVILGLTTIAVVAWNGWNEASEHSRQQNRLFMTLAENLKRTDPMETGSTRQALATSLSRTADHLFADKQFDQELRARGSQIIADAATGLGLDELAVQTHQRWLQSCTPGQETATSLSHRISAAASLKRLGRQTEFDDQLRVISSVPPTELQNLDSTLQQALSELHAEPFETPYLSILDGAANDQLIDQANRELGHAIERFGNDDPRVISLSLAAASLNNSPERADIGISLLRQSRFRLSDRFGFYHPVTMQSRNVLSVLRWHRGTRRLAVSHWLTTHSYGIEAYDPIHPLTLAPLLNLLDAEVIAGKEFVVDDTLATAKDSLIEATSPTYEYRKRIEAHVDRRRLGEAETTDR